MNSSDKPTPKAKQDKDGNKAGGKATAKNASTEAFATASEAEANGRDVAWPLGLRACASALL